jgi:hypothetical protein
MSWYPFENEKTIGQLGSESGIILQDEEHADGGRITLERGCKTAPFAITCGIYGWMLHTRFFGVESEAHSEFEKMKMELSKIISAIPRVSDPEVDYKAGAVSETISEFVRRFP